MIMSGVISDTMGMIAGDEDDGAVFTHGAGEGQREAGEQGGREQQAG
jgi:hypothetical protein